MKAAAFLFALTLPMAAVMALPAAAQPASTVKLFAPGADIPALIAQAKANQKSPNANSIIPLLVLKPYQLQLEYRTGVTPPTVHHGQAEMIEVLKGSASLATGGKLVDARPSRPGSITDVGSGITGATKRHITVGDRAMIPPDTAHQFQDIHGEFVIVAIHMPVPQD